MIESRIFQGSHADVEREVNELLERLADGDYDATNFKFDMSTCSTVKVTTNGVGIVTTVMVVWEQLDLDISEEDDV